MSTLEKAQSRLSAMDANRAPWFSHWRELAEYFLPRRYSWLSGSAANRGGSEAINRTLLNSTSIRAIKTLASGMMNGVSSPSRQWVNFRRKGVSPEDSTQEEKVFLSDTEQEVLTIIAESNFYNAMAVHYIDYCVFGTASTTIAEDYESVFRCYNHPVGEFYIEQDSTGRITSHGRRFSRTVAQLVDQFGLDAVSPNVRTLYAQGAGGRNKPVDVAHLIEKNEDDGLLSARAKFRECYWEVGRNDGRFLAVNPYYSWPTVTTRWEVVGNDPYGYSPAMDALGDVKELQSLVYHRSVGLDKTVNPPMIVDMALKNRPKALSAGGLTYAANSSQNFGAKPAVQVQVPFGELRQDEDALKTAIRETCYNHLFDQISQLGTVRSATEIDARREEKLIQLGPVLERFYAEGLEPAIRRILDICRRAGLLPEVPQSMKEEDIELKFISILSAAQRAADTASIERFFAFVGQAAGVFPEAVQSVNVPELVREYASSIGLRPRGLRTREEVEAASEAQAQQQQLAQTAAIGNDLASGAKVLSETDLSGNNALRAVLG